MKPFLLLVFICVPGVASYCSCGVAYALAEEALRRQMSAAKDNRQGIS